MPTTTATTPRIGARVLLLDAADRVLLIHALDPQDPGHHWWELPATLPELLDDLLADRLPDTPLTLVD
ncbi:MAG: hypothetical protein ACRDSR_07970 [Pseudonocardiaceae bacterium]